MNEHSFTLTNAIELSDAKTVSTKVFRTANLASINSSDPNVLR